MLGKSWWNPFSAPNGKRNLNIGIYGSPNSGKTMLANRISCDLGGVPVGHVSKIPHETRRVQRSVELQLGCDARITLLDMPGIVDRIDYREFLVWCEHHEAVKRAREAALGVIVAIRWLDFVDQVILVIDSTKEPFTPTNLAMIANLEARGKPFVLVANKVDEESADPWYVQESFPQYSVCPVSALTGFNMGSFYQLLLYNLLKCCSQGKNGWFRWFGRSKT